MNIENLASYLNNKEPFTEKSISEIMHVLEKHPYFQIGHMLLLKGIQLVQPDNYNKQLKISGSFISDKRKLFQFINQEFSPTKIKKEEKTEEKSTTKSSIRTKDTTEGKISSIEKTIPTKVEPQIKNANQDTVDKTKQEIKEPVIKEPVKKKVDLPEDQIEKIADENSKEKHHKIVKDFFHSTRKKQEDVKVIEAKNEETKKPVVKEINKEAPKTIIKEVKKEPQVIKKEESPVKKEPIQEKKIIDEIQKKEPTVKEIPLKKEPSIQKQEPEKKQEITAKKIIKEVDITEKTSPVKIEEKTLVEKKEKTEELAAKDIIAQKKTVSPPKKKTEEADAMNNIFSKIRQIKKEMNIDSGSTPETIDIKTKEEYPKLKKTTGAKSSSGRVIKESFIGFDQTPTTEEKKEVVNKKEEPTVKDENEQIKESEITAKDLFKRHKLKKEISSFEETEATPKKETEKTSVSPISKHVDVVNTKTEKAPELKKEPPVTEIKKETPIVKEKTTIEDSEKVINEKVTSGEISAAEALLQKIAEKKKRIQQEKIEEERKKEEEKQKEVEAVDELIKKSSEQKEEKETPAVTIEKKEEKTSLKTKTEETPTKKEAPASKSKNLIDNFIEKVDTLERIGSKEPKIKGDISKESTVESEEIMTETYADLLIQQKNYQKAIEVYKKLILKFPEKKTYFAIQIKKVESLIK